MSSSRTPRIRQRRSGSARGARPQKAPRKRKAALAFHLPVNPPAGHAKPCNPPAATTSSRPCIPTIAVASARLAVLVLASLTAAAQFTPANRPQVKRSQLVRRNNTNELLAEFQPLESCDAPIYCKPAAGAKWYAGDEQVVVQWNKAQANLLTTGNVDLTLYERRKDNPSNLSDHNLIYQEKNVAVARGFRFINVDNTTIFSKWKQPVNIPGNTPTIRIHFWVIAASFAPQTTNEAPGPDFFIISTPRPANASTTVTAPTTTSTVVQSVTATKNLWNVLEEALSRPTTVAALSAIGLVLLAALIGVIFWYRRKIQPEAATSPREDTRDIRQSSSLSTMVGLDGQDGDGIAKSDTGSAKSPVDKASSAQPEKEVAEQENGPISLLDARMIALAFRQLLRKPSWMGASDGSPAPAEEVGEVRQKAEEEFRRWTRELVRQELNEEGKGLKTVNVHRLSKTGSQADGLTPQDGASEEERTDYEADGAFVDVDRTDDDSMAVARKMAVTVEAQSATVSGEISSPELESSGSMNSSGSRE